MTIGGWFLEHNYYVYIMASRKDGAIYIGVTNDLVKRAWEHRNKIGSQHVIKYNIFLLVYYEHFTDVAEAILREKRLKKWHRNWKNKLIEKENPDWQDLGPQLGLDPL